MLELFENRSDGLWLGDTQVSRCPLKVVAEFWDEDFAPWGILYRFQVGRDATLEGFVARADIRKPRAAYVRGLRGIVNLHNKGVRCLLDTYLLLSNPTKRFQIGETELIAHIRRKHIACGLEQSLEARRLP